MITIDDKVRDRNLQYKINREAQKTSALSSGTIDEHEYLAGVKILPSDQSRMVEEAKFIYSPLQNVSKNKQKKIEDPAKKRRWRRKTNLKHRSNIKVNYRFLFKRGFSCRTYR